MILKIILSMSGTGASTQTFSGFSLKTPANVSNRIAGGMKVLVPLVLAVVAFFYELSNSTNYHKHIGKYIPQYNLKPVSSLELQVPAKWAEKVDWDDCMESCKDDKSKKCLEEKVKEQNNQYTFAEQYYSTVQVYKYSMGCYGHNNHGYVDITEVENMTAQIVTHEAKLPPLLFDATQAADLSETTKAGITELSMALSIQNLQDSLRTNQAGQQDMSFCNCVDDFSSSLLEDQQTDANLKPAKYLEDAVTAYLAAWEYTIPPHIGTTAVAKEAHMAVMRTNKEKALEILQLASLTSASAMILIQDALTFNMVANANNDGYVFTASSAQEVAGNKVKLTAGAQTNMMNAIKPALKNVRSSNIFGLSKSMKGVTVNTLFEFCDRFAAPTYTVEFHGVINSHYYFVVGLFLLAGSALINLFFSRTFHFEGHSPQELKKSFLGDVSSSREFFTNDTKGAQIKGGVGLTAVLAIVGWATLLAVADTDGQNFEVNDYNVHTVFVLLNLLLIAAVILHLLYAYGSKKPEGSTKPIHDFYLRYPWMRCVLKDAPVVAAVFSLSVAIFAQAGLQDSDTLIVISLLFAGAALLQHFSNMLADAVQPYENKLILGLIDDDAHLTGPDPMKKYKHDLSKINGPEDMKFTPAAKQIGFSSYAPQMNMQLLTTGGPMSAESTALLPAVPPHQMNVDYHKLLRYVISIRLFISAVILLVIILSLSFIKNTNVEGVGYSMLSAQTLVFSISVLVLLCFFDLYYEISNSGVGDVRRAYMELLQNDIDAKSEDIKIFLKKTYREHKPLWQVFLICLFIIVHVLLREYSRMRAEQFSKAA